MRWRLAILLTCGLLGASFLMMAFVSYETGLMIILLALTVSAIWIAADSGSFGWGLGALFLWPLFFPAYLIEKETRERRVDDHVKALELRRGN